MKTVKRTKRAKRPTNRKTRRRVRKTRHRVRKTHRRVRKTRRQVKKKDLRGGVGERDAKKKAITAIHANPTYGKDVFNARLSEASSSSSAAPSSSSAALATAPPRAKRIRKKYDCHTIESKKNHLISIGYNEYAKTPAILSVVRSLSDKSVAQVTNMAKFEVDMIYNAWRLEEAARRKELRDAQRRKGKYVVPSTSRTTKKTADQDAAAAYEAALALLALEQEIEEETEREMYECGLEGTEFDNIPSKSPSVDLRAPTPTISVEDLPPGFSPIKETSKVVKPASNVSRWTPGKNTGEQNWALHSNEDEDDNIMRLMSMDTNIGIPPVTR